MCESVSKCSERVCQCVRLRAEREVSPTASEGKVNSERGKSENRKETAGERSREVRRFASAFGDFQLARLSLIKVRAVESKAKWPGRGDGGAERKQPDVTHNTHVTETKWRASKILRKMDRIRVITA